MIKINLLSSANIRKEERNDILILAIIAMLIVSAGLASLYFVKFNAYNVVKIRISQTEAELAQYVSIVKQVDELEATKNTLETKRNVITTLRAKGLMYAHFLDDLISVIPSRVALRSMQTKAVSDKILSVNISGEAGDNYAIADFITELGIKGYFNNIELGAITSTQTNETSISTFQLKFTYERTAQ